MGKQKPETVINDWCSFHLDDTTSRWPAHDDTGPTWMHEGVRVGGNGFVYAGDGIVAALAKAGYKIVPT